ncbi:ABC transporter permease [Robertmurraya siralis]|uniref:ABC transporter permease n=1 Tax=Robertmurraya siralis TaxID=77777 RepID=UPI0010F5C1BF|nr:FtsX-like permease family protein [Robertmurraya siralis]
MNIVNKLTIRHLRKNRRRTLITIIGVIISVAMIMAVSTLAVSFLDLMKRQSIASNGEWHVQYSDVTKEQLETIAKEESTSKLVVSRDRGYAKLANSQNKNKPYLFVKELSEPGFEQFPIELSEGRLPQAANEIVISEEIKNDAGVNYRIGQKVTLDFGKRVVEGYDDQLRQNDPLAKDENGVKEELVIEDSQTFTIVGVIKRPIWESTWSPAYTVINLIEPNLLSNDDVVDAVVVVDKINRSLYKTVEQVASENKIETIKFNKELLRFYGVTDNDELQRTLYSLACIIMVVIVIGSVSLIYNAFAISVSERARHLGMLSSVGATRKQKRDSVFFEGAIIALISIPIGIVAGLGGIAVTFLFINSLIEGALGVTEKLEVVVTPLSLLLACVVSLLTIFISTFLPARKASKIAAIDAIRQTQDIKLSGRTVKTSKLVRTIFGIEAEIGLKNMKRNKRRYKATVFSLVISIVLYLSVSFFTSNISKSAQLSQDGINFDIQVEVNENDLTNEELQSLTGLTGITDYSIQKKMQLMAPIKKEAWPKELHDIMENEQSQGDTYDFVINLYGLDESSFQRYVEQIGANKNDFEDNSTINAIVIDEIKYQDYRLGKFVETKAIEMTPGEVLDTVVMDDDSEEEVSHQQIKLAALTDQVPMGIMTSGVGALEVIVREEVLEQIIKEDVSDSVQTNLFINSSDPMETQKALEAQVSTTTYVYNVSLQKQKEEQFIMLLSVFTYGFIALISLISVANIFNTISTSISLRKREFAMLKSVGMTPKGFNKLINYESVFYGVKALLYGLPISAVVMALIHWSLQGPFSYGLMVPWMNIVYVIIAIFIIVSSVMLYSIRKIKKENIIDGLIQENI